MCLNWQKPATENAAIIVQKLWRTKILCGNRWKSQKKSTTDYRGNFLLQVPRKNPAEAGILKACHQRETCHPSEARDPGVDLRTSP
jgi:hypothetical protein